MILIKTVTNNLFFYFSYVKAKSEKAKASAAMNTDPARVGRLGYAGLREFYYKNKVNIHKQYPVLAKLKAERSILYLYARLREGKKTGFQVMAEYLKSVAEDLVIY